MGAARGKKEQGEGASCQIGEFREVPEEVASELGPLGEGRSGSSIKTGKFLVLGGQKNTLFPET